MRGTFRPRSIRRARARAHEIDKSRFYRITLYTARQYSVMTPKRVTPSSLSAPDRAAIANRSVVRAVAFLLARASARSIRVSSTWNRDRFLHRDDRRHPMDRSDRWLNLYPTVCIHFLIRSNPLGRSVSRLTIVTSQLKRAAPAHSCCRVPD